MSTPTILLTGGTGFLGRHFRESNSPSRMPSLLRLAVRSEPKEATHEYATITDIHSGTNWMQALDGVSAVLHLAGKAHLPLKRQQWDDFRETNTLGTLNLARQAVTAGVKRFVFVSSIGVHGEESDAPLTEESAIRATSPYARSKWEAECGLMELANQTGLEVVIVRPPLIYGSGAPGNFGSLVRLVRLGIPLPFATLQNRRSLVSAQNLSDFLWLCLSHQNAAGHKFLICDGEEISTGEMVRRISRAFDCKSRLFALPTAAIAALCHIPVLGGKLRKLTGNLPLDAGKAFRVLGWSPPFSGQSCFQLLGGEPISPSTP